MLRLVDLFSAVGIFFFILSTRATAITATPKFNFLTNEEIQIFQDALRKPHEDTYLSTMELINKYGYNPERHFVNTSDGYVLEMHRITGPKTNSSPQNKPVVFLMHGLLCSSTDWIISGPEKALGYILADEGYDVWMGNSRGNIYSRKHLYSSVNEKSYWKFSWDEIGRIDLPTMIDYILEKTGIKKIFYIGHSQGTTTFFVMASQLPEYNDKIVSMHALAPVAFCKNMQSPPFRFLTSISNELEYLANLIGMYEFRPTINFHKSFASKICDEDLTFQPFCSNVIFIICGFNPSQMNMTLLPRILGHVPAGASVNQFVHYAQLIKSNLFLQFNHGFLGNLKKYGTITPPKYDLSKITTRVSLHYSRNDWLAHTKDVERLYRQLSNPIGKIRVPQDTFNHLDYLWAIDGRTLVYEKVISIMSRYRHEAIYGK